MVVIPFGILLGPILAMYNAASVLQAFTVTMVVSAGMWIVGTAIPPITRNWGGFLMGGLFALMGGYLVDGIMPLFGMRPVLMGVLPWLGTLVFSGLIVWDINKAMQLPKTPHNAVNSAVGVYLDIYNLFMQLLQIFGRRNND
jgi:FtsH-binding integral membrane protein